MADLVASGAPIDGPIPTTRRVSAAGSVIEAALLNQREVLIDPLIAKGALQSGGQPDQAKIDAAFRAAIRGGRMMLVQKIWQAGGVEHHPALTFDDVAGDAQFVRFLLGQGMSPSTPGKYGLPALGSAKREDVAMVLLEAGTDMSHMNDSGWSFRHFAEDNHWGRVVEWLTAHR
jgi:hypothetical protein